MGYFLHERLERDDAGREVGRSSLSLMDWRVKRQSQKTDAQNHEST